jgi:ankyrin repeat protein
LSRAGLARERETAQKDCPPAPAARVVIGYRGGRRYCLAMRNAAGDTALDIAQRRGYADIVRLLQSR